MKEFSKNIVIGVTGCIAAYKVPELVRLFIKDNFQVDVILTKSAQQFVTPVTLATVSRNKVHTELFCDPCEYDISHISLADKADLLLIAPATANIIGKIANGIADDLLSTTAMATKAPVVIAPAMNVNMWENSIVQDNLQKLRQRGYLIFDPEKGELACGYEGVGRLQDINLIFQSVRELFSTNNPLKGKKILITMGGTREYIDPVRYITNKSSGKMGLAIAQEAVKQGADVTVLTTVPVCIEAAKIVNVETAHEMLEAVKGNFQKSDILIMAAAVADYTVKKYSDHKIKKNNDDKNYNIELIRTTDILKELSKIKQKHQKIIGFAAETENLINYATEKLKSKQLDLIVANDVSRKDTGMGSDYNEVTFIFPDGRCENLPKTTKSIVARKLLEILNKYL